MYKLQNAEQINFALASLPKAIERSVWIPDYKDEATNKWKLRKEKGYKAIVVEDKVVSIPSKHYELVQHEQAFRPLIEGLTLRGVENFKFSLFANCKKAWLNVFVGEGYDTVRFGFRGVNSFDRSTAITFGLSSFVKNKTIEIVGYRQVCANGMIVRVPLENAEFVKEEEVIKIKELLSKKMKIRHSSLANIQLEELQFTVEAFLLMKNPLQRIIQKAQSIELYREEAMELIKKYVGQRRLDKIMERYGHEEQTLWGCFNAITFIASRSYLEQSNKATKFNSLAQKAATMLEEELKVSSS